MSATLQRRAGNTPLRARKLTGARVAVATEARPNTMKNGVGNQFGRTMRLARHAKRYVQEGVLFDA